jgi:hypothetical protein
MRSCGSATSIWWAKGAKLRERGGNETKFETLWKEFVSNKKLSPATQKKWKPYFQVLIERMNSDDMARTTERIRLDWHDDLEKSELSPVTIPDGYLAATNRFSHGRSGRSACRQIPPRKFSARRDVHPDFEVSSL